MDSSKSPTEQQQQGSTTRRRRSSGPSYESLMNYKRSSDPNSIARRASLNEQKPQSGFFGSMWHKDELETGWVSKADANVKKAEPE
ncbi:hypothetical protein O1611_g1064 [Lasiodiplodia mahajangana]|uniref:Uncharacterized protein n=1 Tax=Lasiodiplodia mahajangana TaxID=1108764 RepID=A0ACC2JYH3_9PEZI|nr:hypothetical protein O1611_g1064 [Lasiodiplodia mahajangana]